MATSKVVTVTTTAQWVDLSGSFDLVELVVLADADATVTARVGAVAVSEADGHDAVLPAIRGQLVYLAHRGSFREPRISLISSAGSVKVAVRGTDRL